MQLASVDEGSDCDDMNAGTIGDDDGDGYTFCTEDCDDTDATVNPDGIEVYYDGTDQDCDGMSDFDQDMDGVDVYEVDCDGDGVLDNTCDFDGNGTIDWRGDVIVMTLIQPQLEMTTEMDSWYAVTIVMTQTFPSIQAWQKCTMTVSIKTASVEMSSIRAVMEIL